MRLPDLGETLAMPQPHVVWTSARALAPFPFVSLWGKKKVKGGDMPASCWTVGCWRQH